MIPVTTVSRALDIIAPRFGLTVNDNRDELVSNLNELRSLMYASYQRYEIAVDRKVCLPIQSYCLDCNRCDDKYSGITLPYDAAAPESIKIWDHEITRHSAYKDFDECGKLEAWDVAGRVPTQKDIECGCAGRLFLNSDSKKDDGQQANITFLDSEGHEREETLEFGNKTRTEKAASRVLSVALPWKRSGTVRIYWQNGKDEDVHLSTYHRSETVPNYTRVRFNTRCKCMEVDVIYARHFFEVFDDDELVETDNTYALKEFAAYLSINQRRNNSQTDRQEAETHRLSAEAAIAGIQRRSEGVSQDHRIVIRGGISRRSGLISKRR